MSFSKILNKYKLIPKPAKATFWAAVCSVVQKCISFLTTPIFTRIMTTDQYGLCSIYDSWYMIILLFTSLSVFQNGFNNAMVKYGKKRDEYVSTCQSLVFLITIVIGITMLMFNKQFCSLTTLSLKCLIVMILELLFVPAYSLWMARKRFEFEYVGVVVGTLLIAALSPILGVIAVMTSASRGEAKIVAFGIVQILAGIFFFVFNYIKGKKIYDKEMWLYTLKLNIPLIPYYLSSIVLAQADRIMINNMEGATPAAIYSLAYTLSLIMTIVSNSINQSLIPYIYNKIKSGEFSVISKIVSLSCLIVCAMNIFLMLLGPELISFFGTKEYYNAQWIIPPVTGSVFFIFLYSMFGVIQMYWGKTNTMVTASVSAAILNIGLNYIGIKYFGYIAAGYTTLFSYVVLSIAYYFRYRKIINEKMNGISIYNIQVIIEISIFMIVAIISVLILYRLGNILRYLTISGMTLGFIYFRKELINTFEEVRR